MLFPCMRIYLAAELALVSSTILSDKQVQILGLLFRRQLFAGQVKWTRICPGYSEMSMSELKCFDNIFTLFPVAF